GQRGRSLAVPVGHQRVESVDVPVGQRAAAEAGRPETEYAGANRARQLGEVVDVECAVVVHVARRGGQVVEDGGVGRDQPGGTGEVVDDVVPEQVDEHREGGADAGAGVPRVAVVRVVPR